MGSVIHCLWIEGNEEREAMVEILLTILGQWWDQGITHLQLKWGTLSFYTKAIEHASWKTLLYSWLSP